MFIAMRKIDGRWLQVGPAFNERENAEHYASDILGETKVMRLPIVQAAAGRTAGAVDRQMASEA